MVKDLTAEEAKAMQDKLNLGIAELGLSVRTTNCLENEGIFTVEQLLNRTQESLLQIGNFGQKTLTEVFNALEAIGFPRVKK